MDPEIEIPILADSLSRDEDDFNRIARCVFLTVVADEPEPGLSLLRNGQTIPFVQLALQGILYRPLGELTEFTHPDQIDALIAAIEGSEAEGPFTVETGIVWLPTRWLDAACSLLPQEGVSEADRGFLFRVSLSLFRRLWQFTDNRIHLEDLIQPFPGDVPGQPTPLLRFSPSETIIFGEWAEQQF